MLETRREDGQAPALSPAAVLNSTNADDPVAEMQAPSRGQVEPGNEGASLRFSAKVNVAAPPLPSSDAPSGSSADPVLPAMPHDPPRFAQPRDAAGPDMRRWQNDAAPAASPLGEAVLADQAQRRRETPPVIKVTIDRIDIRSPEPPRAAPTVKPAPKPSVSLSDYLRRPGSGGRA
ncbi:hypothetical protein [Bradyrhizobium sp. 930_D9_N1_4]|uniref:hypothetical protein n=1 Tax=Bradyrhizobium sp. 930_D9_N1_4 TaxID=3240374 RepID=UPI003F8A60F1